MSFEYKVWLYGTSTSKPKKTFSRIKDDSISKAKGFHVFVKKTPRSKWQRLTSEIEMIPSSIRSNIDKEIFIELFTSIYQEEIEPKKIISLPKPPEPPKAPKPPKKPKPIPTPEPLPLPPEPIKEIELPELPKEPRVTLTKKQFDAQMSRILYDELDLENMKWSDKRIDSFIEKMWKSFKHAPHLIASEQFRRGLVSKEIKQIKDKTLRKKKGEMEESFRKDLEKRDVSLDPEEVGGDVKVQFKEVFNSQYMKKPDDMTYTTLENGLRVEKPRQSAFAQVHVEYDKMMAISKESLFANDAILNMALDKTRKDIEKLFDQAVAKGLFKPGEVPEYAFRLLVPLVDGKGEIPSDYYSKKGKKRTGHGYGTVREKIKNKKDLKKVLDGLFSNVKQALARYIKLNRSAGFMISGFTMERLIR
jgi:hypothetical protein